MAIVPTGAIYKALTFDGVSSRSFGVHITGEAVYNAPAREVEMISIPGRNGAFALDKGRFENIEVSYPAGIFADTEADFAAAVSDFRNYLCSRSGYVRLTDEYNPNEYRLAIYKSGLEVDPAQLKAGEFDIVFDCKPQRFLTSGEDPISVESGDTVTNPTRFASSPMIEATGEGSIDWGAGIITINNDPIGDIGVFNYKRISGAKTASITFDDTYANAGDLLSLDGIEYHGSFNAESYTSWALTNSGEVNYSFFTFFSSTRFAVTAAIKNAELTYGTPETLSGSLSVTISTVDHGDVTLVVNLAIVYDGTNGITATATTTVPQYTTEVINSSYPNFYFSFIILQSSQYAIGAPLYIDLDIGEAYKIEDGSVVSVNNAVNIPPELPTLKPGANVITFDNTFEKIEIVPRWWRV